MFKFSGYIPPAQGSLSIEALQLSFLNARAARFSKNEAVFFFDEFFMRLKGKRAVFRQILAGDPLEAQICHFEPANHHFEAKMKHFEAKRMHFEARTKHFEAKIAHFEAKIVHFAVENGHFEAF